MMLQASPTAPLLKVDNLVVEYSVGGKTVHGDPPLAELSDDRPMAAGLNCGISASGGGGIGVSVSGSSASATAKGVWS